MSENTIPADILACWQSLRGARVSRITTGLINETYRLDTATSQFILQRLHPVFSERVNLDIQAVTQELSRCGLTTPHIVPTDNGALWCSDDHQVWRLLTSIPGQTVQAITGTKMAFQAGRIAAQFHDALADFEYDYQSGRAHVHDTQTHLKNLSIAMLDHGDHRLYQQVSRLADHVLRSADQFDDIDELPLRHCHGDLKVSNILFDDQQQSICLIDLDTVNKMAWPLEMGDALRSWCNPKTEDQPGAQLNLKILDAAMSGYASVMPQWLTKKEKKSLITGLARICLELSARFLTDALNETYFGWDSRLYPGRGEHNLARGKAMSALYDDVISKRAAAQALVKDWLI